MFENQIRGGIGEAAACEQSNEDTCKKRESGDNYESK
jgi:hypothetical protein